MDLRVEALSLEIGGRPLFAHLSWHVRAGSCVAVMGPSGVGKTSLLNAIAGLIPSSGSIVANEISLSSLSNKQREEYRLRHVGMVFQDGDLLPELTALENAELPARLLGCARRTYQERARRDLALVGLDDRAESWPNDLSGGEVQRVAIARALSNEPELLLADEPTGALDRRNAAHVAELLTDVAHNRGTTVVIATHDPAIAKECDEIYRCENLSLTKE